ncbi:hypothetical protein Rs2_21262 [Raphanus sativus]|nr:hypothetical protein Rs2_21262 [Raphanus sativus]
MATAHVAMIKSRDWVVVGGSLLEAFFRLCSGFLLPSLSSSLVVFASVLCVSFFGSRGGSIVVGRLCFLVAFGCDGRIPFGVVNFPARGSRIGGFVPLHLSVEACEVNWFLFLLGGSLLVPVARQGLFRSC